MKNFKYVLGLWLLAIVQVFGFRCVVYGDCRATTQSEIFNRPVLSFINSQIVALDPRPEFVIFLGDMVRGCFPKSDPSPYVLADNTLNVWKSFMTQTLNGIPFYTVVGNNDLYGRTGWTEYVLQGQYQSIFSNMPNNGPTNYKKLVYSFEYGSGDERTLFVILDGFGFANVGAYQWDNGYDTEQIDWFREQARSSTASHKFVFTHGPAFSPEGWPVGALYPVTTRGTSTYAIRDIAKTYKFDMFYCAHEHLYSRWNPQPSSSQLLIQTITAGAGAAIDNPSFMKAPVKQAHVFWGYNFVVLDIEDSNVIHHAYKVVPNSNSGYVAANLDKVLLIK